MSTVRKEIQSLSVVDRLQLIEEIWDSLIETPDEVPVTDAQRREPALRRRAHARNPSAATSWAQVRARRGAVVKRLRFTPEAELDLERLTSGIKNRRPIAAAFLAAVDTVR